MKLSNFPSAFKPLKLLSSFMSVTNAFYGTLRWCCRDDVGLLESALYQIKRFDLINWSQEWLLPYTVFSDYKLLYFSQFGWSSNSIVGWDLYIKIDGVNQITIIIIMSNFINPQGEIISMHFNLSLRGSGLPLQHPGAADRASSRPQAVFSSCMYVYANKEHNNRSV